MSESAPPAIPNALVAGDPGDDSPYDVRLTSPRDDVDAWLDYAGPQHDLEWSK